MDLMSIFWNLATRLCPRIPRKVHHKMSTVERLISKFVEVQPRNPKLRRRNGNPRRLRVYPSLQHAAFLGRLQQQKHRRQTRRNPRHQEYLVAQYQRRPRGNSRSLRPSTSGGRVKKTLKTFRPNGGEGRRFLIDMHIVCLLYILVNMAYYIWILVFMLQLGIYDPVFCFYSAM